MLATLLLVASLLAAFLPDLRPVVLALDVLAVALFSAEFLRTPTPAALELSRRLPRRVGLSAELLRLLTLRPGRAAGFELEVREAFPKTFAVGARGVDCVRLWGFDEPLVAARAGLSAPVPGDPTGGCDRVRLPGDPADEVAVPRVYRPQRRGRHALGDLRLRLRSPLGLLWRQARLQSRQSVDVVPALAGLRRTLRLAASERWHELGVRRLRRRGVFSSDFESLRPYVHGDDSRLVDWKATARRGSPAVRQFQVERGQELVILVDCGRRMAAATQAGVVRSWTKLDHALDAALQLAAVALQQGDRVGLCAFDDGLRAWVPPGRGARVLQSLMEASFDLAPRAVEFDLARALREIRARHRRRALTVVLSDVGERESAGRTRRALRASAGQRVIFAALDDPEVRAAAAGSHPPGAIESALRAAALQAEEERRGALQQLALPGVRVLDAVPAETAGPLLTAWLDARHA